MIKAISFDFDETLVSRELELFFWYEEIPKLYASQHKIPLSKAKKICYSQFGKLSGKKPNWFDPGWWFKRFSLKKDHKQMIRDLRHLVKIYPETKKVLKKLRLKKLKLIVVSNAHRDFLDLKVEAAGLEKYFDKIYSLPSDLKTTKSTKAFRQIERKTRLKPSE